MAGKDSENSLPGSDEGGKETPDNSGETQRSPEQTVENQQQKQATALGQLQTMVYSLDIDSWSNVEDFANFKQDFIEAAQLLQGAEEYQEQLVVVTSDLVDVAIDIFGNQLTEEKIKAQAVFSLKQLIRSVLIHDQVVKQNLLNKLDQGWVSSRDKLPSAPNEESGLTRISTDLNFLDQERQQLVSGLETLEKELKSRGQLADRNKLTLKLERIVESIEKARVKFDSLKQVFTRINPSNIASEVDDFQKLENEFNNFSFSELDGKVQQIQGLLGLETDNGNETVLGGSKTDEREEIGLDNLDEMLEFKPRNNAASIKELVDWFTDEAKSKQKDDDGNFIKFNKLADFFRPDNKVIDAPDANLELEEFFIKYFTDLAQNSSLGELYGQYSNLNELYKQYRSDGTSSAELDEQLRLWRSNPDELANLRRDYEAFQSNFNHLKQQLIAFLNELPVDVAERFRLFIETRFLDEFADIEVFLYSRISEIDIEAQSRQELEQSFADKEEQLYSILEEIDSTEPSPGSDLVTNGFSTCNKLSNDLLAIGDRLEHDNPSYIDRAQAVSRNFVRSKLLFFQWEYFKSFTHEVRSLDNLSATDNEVPLEGDMVYQFINEVVKDRSNAVLEPNVEPNLSAETRRTLEKAALNSSFNKTVVGEVFRLMDAIYDGTIKFTLRDGSNFDPKNIHHSLGEVQEFVFNVLSKRWSSAGQENGAGEIINQATVRSAIRLHWVITMHQSFLLENENTPLVSDKIFQLFKWVTYNRKYSSRGQATWLKSLSNRLFRRTNEPASYYSAKNTEIKKRKLKDGVPVLDSLVKNDLGINHPKTAQGLFKASLMGLIEMKSHDYLTVDKTRAKRKGYGSYKFLLGHPVVVPDLYEDWVANADIKAKSPESYTFTPPLNYFLLKDKSNNGASIKSETGRVQSFFDVRTQQQGDILGLNEYFDGPVVGTENDGGGKTVTLNLGGRDVKVTFKPELGNQIVYELLPFDDLTSGIFRDYWQHLRDGPYALFIRYIKESEDKLVSSASDPAFWNSLNTTLGYAIPFEQGSVGYCGSKEYVPIYNENGERTNEFSDVSYLTMMKRKHVLFWFLSILEKITNDAGPDAPAKIHSVRRALLESEALRVGNKGKLIEVGFEDITAALAISGERISLEAARVLDSIAEDIRGG